MEKSWSLLVVFCTFAATGFAQNTARDCDAFIHDAHPTDCRKFTNCYDRRFHEFDCIPGLFFNEQKQQCDYFGSDLPGCYRNGSVTVSNPCSQNRCQSPQLCHVVNSRRERFECKCRLGYQGFNCNEDINECAAVPNPCKKGTCVNSIGSFSCDCTGTGYHGMRCERQDRSTSFTNACTSRPCGANGVCQISSQELSGYKCQCNSGFTGIRCQQRLGTGCSSNPCGSNGQCTPDNFSGYRCTCQNGFQGTNCQQDLNECLGAHGCVNGVCENNIGSYSCRCNAGWTGNFCTSRSTTVPNNACTSRPCGANGVCQISSQELSGYKCQCNSGFTGIRCQQRLGTGCSSNPCGSNGQCTPDNFSGYRCTCQNGFQGTNCQQDLNECLGAHGCVNGVCENNIGSYSCRCNAGWTGNFCTSRSTTVPNNACTSRPCGANGVCQISSQELSGYKCQCNSGFTGIRCQQRLGTGCSSNPCGSNGQCTPDNFNGYRCTCQNGFQGTNCQQDLNECLGAHGCVNGVCENNIGSYTCRCNAGWTGNFCNTRSSNPCFPNPCRNNGQCDQTVTSLNGFKCRCTTGYSGDTCEILTSQPCASNPCLNFGTCTPNTFNPNGYSCRCTTGYSGDRCQTLTSQPCASNPCLNFGTCTPNTFNPNGYSCRCTTGYSGDRCQTRVVTADNPCISLSNAHCPWDRVCKPNRNSPTGFVCVCNEGLQGLMCQNDIDECSGDKPNPCHHGGRCLNTFGSFRCNCSSGFAGPTCDFPTGTTNQGCQNHKCQAGRCQVSTFAEIGYTCDCTGTVFSGSFCNFSGCLNSPCKNGGTCTNTVGGNFQCRCPVGLSGQTCDIPLVANNCPDYQCPSDVPDYNYPNWDDIQCASFYNCNRGIISRQNCPLGQKFDVISLRCQDSSDVSAYFACNLTM